MKAKENFSIALLLLLCLPFVRPVRLSAQARNPRAENWFRTGVEERNSQKKIEAYLKAIEYEPLFVEALFNVGVLYRQMGKFDLAETYLRRAYEAKPNDPANKIRPKILLNLAAVQRQLGKLPGAEATLHIAERVASDRKTKSKIAFELGRVLYEQQKYQEALGVLQNGKTLDPTTQSFFSNLIQIVQKEMEVQRLYSQAQQAIARGDLASARAVNNKIKALKPTFSRLDDQIAHLDSVTKTRVEKEFLQDLYNLAKQHTAAGNIVQAINTYELIEQKHPNFMDVRTKLQDLRKLQSKKPAEKTLEENYALGVKALKARNWTGAIIALEKVKAVDPSYLKVKELLAQANQGLEEESTETILSQYYADGVDAMNRNELGTALAFFEKVRNIKPKYKKTASLIAQIERALKAETLREQNSREYVNSLYDKALAAMQNKDWMQAVLILEKLRLLQPDDSNVTNLLAEARENLKLTPGKLKGRTVTKKDRLYYVAGAFAALVVLPLFGFVLFAPTSRARIYYLRGNYPKAALIYERILARHPERMRLYVALANLYLLMGRTDEKALKVFRLLLNLNLATNIHPQINSVLSQKFLTEGQRDTDDTITILENELKMELQKQNSEKA